MAKDQSPSCVGRIRASTRGCRLLTNRKIPNPMTNRLAPIWICCCHSTSTSSSANGRITKNIASRWPTVSGQSAITRARELLSISPAETASGHPIPGFTPWFLHPASVQAAGDQLRAFHQGLKEAGFVDGENVAIEYRWAENQIDRLPLLGAELVRRRVA